jgi:probable HAF family extracellular repeat protein
MQDLGTLGGLTSAAMAINRSGQVVGSAQTADGDTHAFLWTQSGGMQDLGTLGGPSSSATGITDDGAVTGYSQATTGGPNHAFFWTAAGGMKDFGRLGENDPEPQAINNHRWIVGFAPPAPPSNIRGYHAFVRIPQVGVQDLGCCQAFAVNINGAVVGMTVEDGDGNEAFLWTQAGGMQDPGKLVTPQPVSGLIAATGINAGGKIVADQNINGVIRAVVLIP